MSPYLTSPFKTYLSRDNQMGTSARWCLEECACVSLMQTFFFFFLVRVGLRPCFPVALADQGGGIYVQKWLVR